MFRNYFVINVILLVAIALLGFRFHSILATPLEIPDAPSSVDSGALKIKTSLSGRKGVGEDSFDVISEKNLFSPSRTASKAAKEEPQPTVDTSKFQLFGTTIMTHKKFALLEDPESKKTKLYYLNDRIAGFTVSDISEDKVILKKGDESIELRLRADKKFTPAAPVQRRGTAVQNRRASRSRQIKRPQPPGRRPVRRPRRRRPARRYTPRQ
jgi:hypothetical protein